jgi:putative FmdB family regulatory protein
MLGAMPIYEFHCSACRHDSELLVRSADWEGTECPHCGSTKLSKKFSVFASNAAGATGGAGEMTACGAKPSSSCCGCSGRGPHRH